MPNYKLLTSNQTRSNEKEFNALNLELTISFTLMNTTMINNTASNFTVDNLKLKSYFVFRGPLGRILS